MNLSHSITTCLTFVIVTHVEIPARPSKHLTPGLQFWVSFQDLATEALEDTCNSETTSESSELNKPLQTSEFTDTFVPSPYCEGSTQALNLFSPGFPCALIPEGQDLPPLCGFTWQSDGQAGTEEANSAWRMRVHLNRGNTLV